MINLNPLQLFCKIGMHQATDHQQWVGVDSGRVIPGRELAMAIMEGIARGNVIRLGKSTGEMLKIENWCGWHRGWY